MIRVTFYEPTDDNAKRAVAVLSWDGQQYRMEPPGQDIFFECVMEARIYDFDRNRKVSAQEPERFMELLHKYYRSGYLWASKMEVVGDAQPA
jgi:hypothetical protein